MDDLFELAECVYNNPFKDCGTPEPVYDSETLDQDQNQNLKTWAYDLDPDPGWEIVAPGEPSETTVRRNQMADLIHEHDFNFGDRPASFFRVMTLGGEITENKEEFAEQLFAEANELIMNVSLQEDVRDDPLTGTSQEYIRLYVNIRPSDNDDEQPVSLYSLQFDTGEIINPTALDEADIKEHFERFKQLSDTYTNYNSDGSHNGERVHITFEGAAHHMFMADMWPGPHGTMTVGDADDFEIDFGDGLIVGAPGGIPPYDDNGPLPGDNPLDSDDSDSEDGEDTPHGDRSLWDIFDVMRNIHTNVDLENYRNHSQSVVRSWNVPADEPDAREQYTVQHAGQVTHNDTGIIVDGHSNATYSPANDASALSTSVVFGNTQVGIVPQYGDGNSVQMAVNWTDQQDSSNRETKVIDFLSREILDQAKQAYDDAYEVAVQEETNDLPANLTDQEREEHINTVIPDIATEEATKAFDEVIKSVMDAAISDVGNAVGSFIRSNGFELSDEAAISLASVAAAFCGAAGASGMGELETTMAAIALAPVGI